MKKIVMAVMMLSTGSVAVSAQEAFPILDPDERLAEAKIQYEQGLYGQALSNYQWLEQRGNSIKYSFYDTRLTEVFEGMYKLSEVTDGASKAFTDLEVKTFQAVSKHPQNCESFDDMLAIAKVSNNTLKAASTLAVQEAKAENISARCWNHAAELVVVEHKFKFLIDTYVGKLSTALENNVVPDFDARYLACNEAIEIATCRKTVRDEFTVVTQSYLQAAMALYGLSEGGSVGGVTLKTLLKWQEWDNQ